MSEYKLMEEQLRKMILIQNALAIRPDNVSECPTLSCNSTPIAICNNVVRKEGFDFPVQCGHIVSVHRAKKLGWACSKCGNKGNKESWYRSRAGNVPRRGKMEGGDF